MLWVTSKQSGRIEESDIKNNRDKMLLFLFLLPVKQTDTDTFPHTHTRTQTRLPGVQHEAGACPV